MQNRCYQYFPIFLLIFLSLSCSKSNNQWKQISPTNIGNYLITSVDFYDSERGMLTTSVKGNSSIFVTTNGGTTWDRVYDANQNLHDIHLINKKTAIAVGNNGIVKSQDSGKNWKIIQTPLTEPLIAVDFSNSGYGLAVGRNGTTLFTNNDDEEWEKGSNTSSSFLRDVTFVTDNIAYAVGSAGTILKTVNSGQSWTSQTSNHSGNLSAVNFKDAQKGFAAGGNGALLATVNGGTTWDKRKVKTNNGLLSLSFNKDTGTVVGFGGTIISSKNAGENWKIESKGEFSHLYDIATLDDKTSILVGDNGTILKKR